MFQKDSVLSFTSLYKRALLLRKNQDDLTTLAFCYYAKAAFLPSKIANYEGINAAVILETFCNKMSLRRQNLHVPGILIHQGGKKTRVMIS